MTFEIWYKEYWKIELPGNEQIYTNQKAAFSSGVIEGMDREAEKIKKLEADLRVSIETLKKLKEIRNQKDLNLSEFDSTEALGGLFNYIELTAKQALGKIGRG